MKKHLLYLMMTICTIAIGNAQTIGLVGTGANGWPGSPLPAPQPDIMMSTTDNINFTITNQAILTGEVKFRQDQMWNTSWGSTSFPSGIGTLGGPNIPTVAGTYTINFNIQTGAYSFNGTPAFASIGIWGPAVDSQNGFGGPDVDMVTTDGINYKLSAFNFSSGTAKFRKNDDPLMTYGSTGFPTGTAVADGPNFFVPGGQYTVYFNLQSGEYSFEFPSVGYLGTVLGATGFDGPDINLTTADGFIYTGSGMMEIGELKFRLDDSWSVNWGGTGLTGTAVQNGPNIAIPTAEVYYISFDKSTLDYVISTALAINHFSTSSLNTYPNPAENSWNISSNGLIGSVSIYNSTGRLVGTLTPNANQASLDASALASGLYFAKVMTSSGTHTIKLIKE